VEVLAVRVEFTEVVAVGQVVLPATAQKEPDLPRPPAVFVPPALEEDVNHTLEGGDAGSGGEKDHVVGARIGEDHVPVRAPDHDLVLHLEGAE